MATTLSYIDGVASGSVPVTAGQWVYVLRFEADIAWAGIDSYGFNWFIDGATFDQDTRRIWNLASLGAGNHGTYEWDCGWILPPSWVVGGGPSEAFYTGVWNGSPHVPGSGVHEWWGAWQAPASGDLTIAGGFAGNSGPSAFAGYGGAVSVIVSDEGPTELTVDPCAVVEPDPGEVVDVYDPDGVHLATLTEAFDVSVRVERSGAGVGMFKINRMSPEATAVNLAQGNLVQVTYPIVDDEPIFAFFLDTGDFDLASHDERGGEDLTFGGKGARSYLRRARMWSQSYLESLYHVLLRGNVFIYTASASGGLHIVSRVRVAFPTGVTYSAGPVQVLDWPSIDDPKYQDREYVEITEGPYSGKYVGARLLATPYVGAGQWNLFASGTGSKPGQILRRVIAETQAVDRPQHPLAAMTVDFDYTTDSDGNAWSDGDGATDGFVAQVGEVVEDVVQRLLDTGAIDVVMDRALVLHAYNHYGRDLTGSSFGAGVVRLERGVNPADVIRRSIGLELPATHALIDGDDEVVATAELFDADDRPTVETYISLEGTDVVALAAAGGAILQDALDRNESLILPFAVGDREEEGLYLPGPEGTNGHVWVGDSITVHTGATTIDYVEKTVRVEALNISTDEAGNVQCSAEVAAKYRARRPPIVSGRGIMTARPLSKSTLGIDPALLSVEGVDVAAVDLDLTASDVAIEDTGANFAAANVEEALAELATAVVPVDAAAIAALGFVGQLLVNDGITDPPEALYTDDGTDFLYTDLG